MNSELFGKLNEMKSMVDSSKERLDKLTVEGESGGGLVVVALSGNREMRSLKINTDLSMMTKEDLEDLLMIAFNRALVAADKLNEQETMMAARNFFPGL
jgi:nucleoid-associated protein EbfC